MQQQTDAARPPVAPSARSWTQVLAHYREPSHTRSIVEIAITLAPFTALWVLAWAAYYFGYWWVSLLLAVPAAGFMVRAFMIQHDCGHGAFFRHRLANDWVGRVIGVLTLTPYDFWRRTHAIHHASSGHLERRGMGDIDTLTVREYQALSRWGRLRYRIYRHPVVMFGIGPAYLFMLQHRLPVGLMRGNGWTPWISTMATNLAIAAIVATLIWFIGIKAFLLVHLPITLLAGSDRGVAVLRAAPVRRDLVGPRRQLGPPRGGAAWQLALSTCRRCCAGSRPTSACTMSTIWPAAFPTTGCRGRCATIRNCAASAA